MGADQIVQKIISTSSPTSTSQRTPRTHTFTSIIYPDRKGYAQNDGKTCKERVAPSITERSEHLLSEEGECEPEEGAECLISWGVQCVNGNEINSKRKDKNKSKSKNKDGKTHRSSCDSTRSISERIYEVQLNSKTSKTFNSYQVT
jgi:hypothetical protein